MGPIKIAGYTMAAAAPMTVIAGGATFGWAVSGTVGIPFAYLATAVVLLIFAVGLVAMAEKVINAAAFYAYVSHGLGRVAGLGTAFVAVVAYNLMQVGLYGGFGPPAADFVQDQAGWTTPWVLWAVAAWLLVAVLGVLRIEVSGWILTAAVAAEIVVAVVLAVVNLTHPAGRQTDLVAVSPVQAAAPGFAVAMVIAITGFVGFEQGPLLTDVAKDGVRTVRRAIYGTVLATGALYGFCALAVTVATGPADVVRRATEDGQNLIFNLTAIYLPAWVITVGKIMYLTSVFAALLAFHNSSNRYVLPLARERVLPPVLASTSARTDSPWAASVLQSMVGLAVIGLFVWQGWDPGIYMFFWLTVIAGFGVLVLMVLTAVAIVAYALTPHHRDGVGVLRGLLAPAVAAVLLTMIMVLTVQNIPTLLGLDPDDPNQWIVPSVFAGAFAFGCLYALVLKAARPTVYSNLGRASRLASTIATTRAGRR